MSTRENTAGYPEDMFIFAQLAAPFGRGEIKELPGKRNGDGKPILFINARNVMNRLDDVLGPANWWDHYTETKDGIKCSLTIRLPDGREITKEDGGGFAGLKTADDNEKSAYSDAFKRAAVKFGVGRHLYRDGVPAFVRAMLAAPKPATAPVNGETEEAEI